LKCTRKSWAANICRAILTKLSEKKTVIIDSFPPEAKCTQVVLLGHYIQWTRGLGTQGPKLECTVHVCTVASSLGEYPGPCVFREWVCVSNRMEWAIEFFFEKSLNHFSIAVPQLCRVAIYLVTHS